MTFIELVQRACQESGVIPKAGSPSSVTGANGLEARFVAWVRTAYLDIQRSQPSWFWLRREIEAPIISGQARFSAMALGADRFRSWRPRSDLNLFIWTIFDPVIGRRDEGVIPLVSYDEFRILSRGETETGRPQVVAIDDQQRLCFHPTPDKAYTLDLTYNRAGQSLTVDTDVPEMPADQHMLIVWKTVLLAANFEEGMASMPFWATLAAAEMSTLMDNQAPGLEWGGPLA